MKNEEKFREKYLSDSVNKAIEKLSLKPIGFHVNPDDYHTYQRIKNILDSFGINLNPQGGGIIINLAYNDIVTFYPMARQLGYNPVEYTKKRMDIIHTHFKKLEQEQIKNLHQIHESSVEEIDSNIIKMYPHKK